jgi:2-dehydropantoate 2-reductase
MTDIGQQATPTQQQPRLLVFGAGAIGTYIGGSLALQGCPTVFLERLQVAEELRQRGLRLEIAGEQFHIPSPRMATSVAEALQSGPYDVCIFALKSYDTQAVLESIKPYHELLPPILCLQNGVENEPAIGAAMGPFKVIPGIVTSAVGRRAAGDIFLERQRGVGVSAGHPRSPSLVKVMQAAGLGARLYHKPADMKWSKMLTNLVGNATSAILDMPPGDIFAHAGLFQLEIAQLREALAVMRAQGIRVVDLPATPVRLLAFGVRFLPLSISRPLLKRAVGSGRGGKMPSFHIDLYSGRGKSEVDYLNGAVARFGVKLGFPTPANKLINETLLALTSGELARETYARQPEKFLALWEN